MMQFVISVGTTETDVPYDQFKEQLEESLNELVDEYGSDLQITNIALSDY